MPHHPDAPPPFRWETPTLSENEYADVERRLRRSWETHLKPKGVKFPAPSQLPAFILLAARPGAVVTQDDILTFYQAHGQVRYNRQIRQAAGSGWWLESGSPRATRFEPIPGKWKRGDFRLASIEIPSPKWQKGRDNAISLSKADWTQTLEVFHQNNRGCAVCGRIFEHYDHGHLDPEKPGEAGNIVPMCVDCNNWAANKAGPGRSIAFDFDPATLVARPIIQTSAGARKRAGR